MTLNKLKFKEMDANKHNIPECLHAANLVTKESKPSAVKLKKEICHEMTKI